MNGSLKITISLLTLFWVSACSPNENIDLIENDVRIKTQDGPAPIPIPPVDPVPQSKEKIIIVPGLSPSSPPESPSAVEPRFGLMEIDGSSFLASCPKALQNFLPDKAFCIKIPDEPTDRVWWQDQYVKQLSKLGWKGSASSSLPPYVRTLTAQREPGCRSTIASFILDNEVLPILHNRANDEPLPNLDGTYLVFLNYHDDICAKQSNEPIFRRR